MELPDKIKNAPELDPSLDFFFGAFEDLKNERPAGMSISPISIFTIRKYCKFLDLGESQSEELVYHVQKLDEAFISFHSSR